MRLARVAKYATSMPGVGEYTRTALHGKAANHRAVAKRRSTSQALIWFNHGNPVGTA
jgi:hypothetical protein